MAAVEALPKQAIDALGSLDILVNNAGITRDNLFLRMSDEEWQTVINVNLTATMKLCKGALRGMMKSRWGRIIQYQFGGGRDGQSRSRQLCGIKSRNGWYVKIAGL